MRPIGPSSRSSTIRVFLQHAIDLGYNKIWFRSDSLGLIQAIDSTSKPKELYGILSDVGSLSASLYFCFFSFIPRAQNGPADLVAKSALCNMNASWA
ncbi:hypothetical protein Bca101_041767 [Brassica carinata]